MKILYHHRTLGDGAEGIHIKEMIHAFRELGHEVRIVCPAVASHSRGATTAKVENDRWTARLKRGLPVSIFRLMEVLYNVVTYTKMISAIWWWRPDMVYERYCRSNFGSLLASKHCRVPHVLEVNTPYSIELKLYVGGTHHWLDERLERFILGRVDRIATVSTALKNYLAEQGVSPDRMLVTPNAISPSALPVVHRETARLELGIPKDRLVIGFAGSMRKWHGIDFLMEAWPEILDSCPGNPYLLLIGDGDFKVDVQNRVAEQGWEDCVKLVPSVPHNEVLHWMMAMDIGLMPDSNFYGSPMKIFEYMAMESVACAPRLGPLEEVIQHGSTGVLFEPRDLHSFVDSIRRLAVDKIGRERIARAGREYVLANHRWVDNAQKVIQFAQSEVGKP
ncbi:MAG: glycosyltransferase family 4 protein [Pirellula sp.]